MPYLYKARQFAIDNLPGFNQTLSKEQRGIFDLPDSVVLKEDSESNININKKMHSLFFPMTW